MRGSSFIYEWNFLKTDNTIIKKTQFVKSNPGFSPYVGHRRGNINGYAPPNGLFREAYQSKNGGKYAHEGVDFSCVYGDKIHALISGEVMVNAHQNQGSKYYGINLVIKGNDGFIHWDI